MSAFLIIDVAEIHDPETYARYRAQVSPGLVRAGGRYRARGGKVEVLEGSWQPGRVVVVEFDSPAEARQWWASPEYTELKELRQRATRSHMILVEGLAELEG